MKCKGQIFRAEKALFKTKRGYTHTIRLNLLKRKSCQGCACCGSLEELIKECITEDIIGLFNVIDQKLYRIVMTNVQTDSQGYVDDFDLKVLEVKDDTGINLTQENQEVSKFINYRTCTIFNSELGEIDFSCVPSAGPLIAEAEAGNERLINKVLRFFKINRSQK